MFSNRMYFILHTNLIINQSAGDLIYLLHSFYQKQHPDNFNLMIDYNRQADITIEVIEPGNINQRIQINAHQCGKIETSEEKYVIAYYDFPQEGK